MEKDVLGIFSQRSGRFYCPRRANRRKKAAREIAGFRSILKAFGFGVGVPETGGQPASRMEAQDREWRRPIQPGDRVARAKTLSMKQKKGKRLAGLTVARIG